ncbi:MAG: UDP-N-acetylmuramate--L-alanine ligase [Rickettsiales bacterium]|jgi:UDP-N-acetylmuramate--alanine ligase|nr:UDP-N-acetylmuramate--L-alanine ligase [Rickettsiales bacterium]
MLSNKFDHLLIKSSDEITAKDLVNKKSTFHFIGIGGCGMSGIAKVMNKMGFKVQGSDIQKSDYTNALVALSNPVKVFIGHDEKNIEGVDIIIFSDVIADDNPEMQYALKHNIPVMSRALMLDYIMNMDNKTSIGITGTHGKTTTTSFMSILLQESNMNPKFINGGIINAYHTNAEFGDGKFSTYEACEAYGNVKYFNPAISVITNIELEHMDYYKTSDCLMDYFEKFVERTKELCIIGLDTDLSKQLYAKYKNNPKIKTISLDDESTDIYAKDIRTSLNAIVFTAVLKTVSRETKEIHVEIPILGSHNIKNALCAIYIGNYIGLSDDDIIKACKKFTGNKHRFSNVATVNGIVIIEDYGHHPSEILSVIQTAKNLLSKNSKITVIFEPHKFSRFADCWSGFKQAFSDIENLIITPVFVAGEQPIPNITPENFAIELMADKNSKLENAISIKSFSEIAEYVNKFCKEFDLVLSFSAGALKDYIYSLPSQLEELNKKICEINPEKICNI